MSSHRWLAQALLLVCCTSIAAAQSGDRWLATAGPVVVTPGVSYSRGFVLGLGARVSRSLWEIGPLAIGVDALGHWGTIAAFGDCATVTDAPCSPRVYGQIPWSLGIGPSATYRLRTGPIEWAAGGFASSTWGGINHLTSYERAGTFNTVQSGATLGFRNGRTVMEIGGSELNNVRGMQPKVWTLQFGRVW
jgi:hypothetical protein